MENNELPVPSIPPQFIWRMNELLELLNEILDVLAHIEMHICEECT
jgi:hypothetical protein